MCRKLIYLVSFILVLNLALAGGAQAADPNLVGWWPLNEGAGDIAIDSSGNGNDGTINNLNGGLGTDGSVWVDDPERGTVISFNGTAEGAFVRAGEIPQMTLTNDFTWSFWAKQNAENTASNDIILGNRMDENAVDFVPRQFIKFTPTKFEWHMNGNGDDNLEYDDIPADVWLHHAVVKTADRLTYYRNGVKASSGTFTQPLDFPQPLFFGGDNEGSAGENWGGLMSDVRIYNRALTGLEVLAAKAGVERLDMKIGYAIQTPVIDGEVDDVWAAASVQNFVPLEDPANASGSWQVLYDSDNLYVIVDVTDDSLHNDSAGSWQDDSVELYLDGGNTKLETALSGDDHQYTFGWTTEEIQGTNIDGYTEGIEHAQVDTANGWRIEIKLPWMAIQGAAAMPGDLLGIDCYYNDDDDGGDSREGKMLTFSVEEFWNNASGWGTAVLTVIPEPVDPGIDGLVAFYALDGDPNDSSGNGNNGTIGGTPNWTDGKIGSALEFDGSSTYVEIPFSDSLKLLNQGDFTLSTWFKPDELPPENKEVLQQGDGNGSGRTWLFVHSSNEIRSFLGGGTTASGIGVEAGMWTHGAVVITENGDADTVQLFVNGHPAGEPTQRGMEDCEGVYFIGRHKNPTNFWDGLIDEVQLYNRALSMGEIMYLAGYRAPVDPGTEGLAAQYSLENDVLDSSGNGNDGTIVGAPTFVDGLADYGMAMEFDGESYVDCGSGASLDVTGPISIALWIRPGADDPEGQGTEAAAMAKADSVASPSWSWQVRYGWNSPQPYMAFTFNTSPRAWAYVGKNLERDEWAHIACSHDGETLKCYLDGEETDSTPMGAITSSPTSVLIGSDGWRSDWIGAIDEVAIYDRALSDGEIMYLAGK